MPATYENIATTTLTGTATEVNFTSINSAYTDLILVVDYDTSATILAGLSLRFNSDSGSNYSFTYLQGTGSAAQSGRSSNAAQMEMGYQAATGRSNLIIQIQNYSNTTTNKTAISRHNNPSSVVQSYVGLWRNTAAINAIRVACGSSSFATGSTFTLYGIKAA